MKTEEEIRKKIKEIESDERYSYPTANVAVNAPLALIQLQMESEVRILKWVLGE